MVQLKDDAPCCHKLFNTWICAFGLAIPAGGLSGLLMSIYGNSAWFQIGVSSLPRHFGVD